MSKFRIRKEGREFFASRLETLQDLASRGLLRADDPVSVDDGSFRPASEIEALADALGSAAPAPPGELHWDEADADLDGVDDVLTSFLDQLSSGSMPAVTDPPPVLTPSTGSLPAVGATSPDPAPSAPPPVPEPVPGPAVEPAPAPLFASEPIAADVDAPPATPSTEPAPSLRIVEPPAESREEAPVSFSEWIETKSGGAGGRLLENFGRYDDGVIVAARGRRERVNPWRVLLAVFVGASLIGSYVVYVTTAASTRFPTEAELEKRVPGGFRSTVKPDLPVPEGRQNDRDVELAARSASDRALRDSLGGRILHFSNREGLEDALFQDLLNARLSPASVQVEALELRGGTELGDVPVRANVTVKLSAPRGAEYGDETFQRTLKIAWMLLGKYQAQGRLRFEGATVVVADPLPWDERYEGERLLALWNGQLHADALFLGDR